MRFNPIVITKAQTRSGLLLSFRIRALAISHSPSLGDIESHSRSISTTLTNVVVSYLAPSNRECVANSCNGGESGLSLSVVSSANDKNVKIAGNGGMWSDDGSSDGSDLNQMQLQVSNQEMLVYSLGTGVFVGVVWIGVSVGIIVVSVRVVGGVITGVVSGIVVGIVLNKITRPAGVPILSSDESDETEITEIAMTCTSKVYLNHLYINLLDCNFYDRVDYG
ncbi:hypothetical protein Tco_1516598 [Tanacetum coccineum]